MSDADLRVLRLEANGISFSALEAGSGPLALCLHGFPDTAHTWRHLIPALAGAGYRAVAPFMRGYAATGIPDDGRYTLGALASDANAIHDALGADGSAVLIGHDWGAEAAYEASALAADRWRRLVTLAIPPLALDRAMFADYDQLKRFFYIFAFRVLNAEELLAADGMAFLDRLWADWSPGYDASFELARVNESLAERANLSAAIGYYRAKPDWLAETAPQPTLYLHGADDGCIAADLVGDAPRHLSPGSRMEVIDGVGHFLHLERPEEVNGRILDWISGRS